MTTGPTGRKSIPESKPPVVRESTPPGPDPHARVIAAALDYDGLTSDHVLRGYGIRDLRDLFDQLADAIPSAPPELAAGYEGALRIVTAEIDRRSGPTTLRGERAHPGPVTSTDSEGHPWQAWTALDYDGLTSDHVLRGYALQAAATWLQASGLHSGEVLDLAETWTAWLRTGTR